jgi:hypothetical protein
MGRATVPVAPAASRRLNRTTSQSLIGDRFSGDLVFGETPNTATVTIVLPIATGYFRLSLSETPLLRAALLLLEFQGCRVDAVAEAGGLGTVLEDVPEMGFAAGAMDFGAPHEETASSVVPM